MDKALKEILNKITWAIDDLTYEVQSIADFGNVASIRDKMKEIRTTIDLIDEE